MALEVEPDVAGARLGHEREAALILDRQVLDPVLLVPPVMELELGLEPEPGQRLRTQLRDARVGRQVAELLERRDPGRGELLDLRPGDAGDERQVVVLVPPLLAEREEVAQPAVLDRVRVGLLAVLDSVEEAAAEAPVEGEVVVGQEALELAGAGDDVHVLGHAALDTSDLLGVEAELEDVRGPRVARELRVERLVGAVRLAHDEVGEPTPGAVNEDGLVDDLATVAHRLLGLGGGDVPANLPGHRDAENITAVLDQPLKISRLVLIALAANQISVRVRAIWLLDLALSNLDLQRREVCAGKETIEVRGRERGVCADGTHRYLITCK